MVKICKRDSLIIMAMVVYVAVLCAINIMGYAHRKINEFKLTDASYAYNGQNKSQLAQWNTDAELGKTYRLNNMESIKFSCTQLWFNKDTWTTEVILSVDGVFDIDSLVLKYDDIVVHHDSRRYHDNYAHTYIFTIPAHIETIKAVYKSEGHDVALTIENTEVQPDYFSNHKLEEVGATDE